jgi:hypothetical protein
VFYRLVGILWTLGIPLVFNSVIRLAARQAAFLATDST